MSKFSVKKPFTVFVAVVFALILGVVSFTRMTTDLLPSMNLPYVVVITTYAGASPEKVESTVTEPLESGLGTVNGVVNVTSVSSENYSMVMLEFEEDTDMDSAMVKLSNEMDLISLPDGAGTPILMEISMDMIPVLYASIDYEGMDIYELSEFVEDTVVPAMERQDGVASVDTIGSVEQTVEIALDQDKIDALNDQLAAYVSDELADAKEEIDDASAELEDAKAELAEAETALEEEQDSTAEELGETSLLLDQAVATQTAYEAQLTSLQASQTALETEKTAYQQAGVEESYDQINELMAGIQTAAASIPGTDTDSLPSDISDALENPDKLTALTEFLTTYGSFLGSSLGDMSVDDLLATLTADTLQSLQDAVDRLAEIDIELANLDTEIAAAEAVLEQVNSTVQEAIDSYSELEAGKILAASGFASGAAQIYDAQAALDTAETSLEEAQEAYESARDTALESANLDSLLTLDTLSTLIYAQNFAMPAGYIYEGEDQYLLKVGEEYSSVEELEDTLLCNIDGLGDVRLSDVANVTWIDNSGESYAKVNGNNAVIITVSKTGTAGTASVSDACAEAIADLEAEYEGLQITNLMDQGEYIDLIINSVLQNLIFGAILAIIVLAIFLRSVRPTIVIAVSIPLSVLVALVCMYFTGITLNMISLIGLALAIGMLVDNSIVVLENIYRLRGQGIPSARAAVMGARQVSGAIVASTLTTICVFLPIVFTGGLVKELFVDLALTVAFALVASLVIALTVVPAMSSTLLRKAEPKEQKFLNKILNGYEKSLRFCLKRKVVPIVIAVGLLAACAAKAVNTGLTLFPSMGGDQMSVSMTVNEELSDEEAFAVADEAMEAMTAIEGVEYVGMMSGSDSDSSTSSLLSSSGGTHSLTVYILLDEETSKDNSVIADELEAICESLDLEEYSVATSNMDLSSYMSTGLTVEIYGSDTDTLLAISEDVMDYVEQVEGFVNISNGQEDAEATIELTIDKDEAMRLGLTVAGVISELSTNLTTEETATTLTVDGSEYDVTIVDENHVVDVSSLMDYEFEVETTDDDGNTVTEIHTLSEFAVMEYGESLSSIQRSNQVQYIEVTAETADGYNTTLLSRELEELLGEYEVPDGYSVEVAGEMEEIYDAFEDIILMIILAIAFIYLIMVAQFQSLLSPFIVLFTIPLAFTGGFLAIYIAGQEISLVSMMGFLMLTGVIVNNGIVFVDYANQMRLAGMEKREALVETGRSRMRPILMTMLTTVLAMCTMMFSQDAAAEMTRGMATVVIGGLLYATLMTLYLVPVLYDLFFRREIKEVDVGTDEELAEDI